MVVVSVSFFLSTILLFNKQTPLFLKGFPPYLLFSILIEILAALLIKNDISTTLTYNLSTTVEIAFFLWVLSNMIEGNSVKKLMHISIVAYPCLSFLDIYLIQGKDIFHSIGYALGCLLIVLFTIIFFYQLFAKPKAIVLSREPTFWICTGLLLFYSVTFPLYVSVNFMKTFPAILANNVQYLLIVLNVFLYLLFSIAFLCRIKIKKF
jgi:hypothetical protein